MQGIDATNGKSLSGVGHLRQSIVDILTTPIGSRVMRREYGSGLFRLIDAPLNRSGVMDVVAAVADALERWEPRFRLTRVSASQTAPGALTVDVVGEYLPDGREIVIDGIEVN
jgi:hypothetical protein